VKEPDSLATFIIGLFIGAALVGLFCFDAVVTQNIKIIENACGTCQERGKICGEYVCSKDGWK
jgi:hypothetical protein